MNKDDDKISQENLDSEHGSSDSSSVGGNPKRRVLKAAKPEDYDYIYLGEDEIDDAAMPPEPESDLETEPNDDAPPELPVAELADEQVDLEPEVAPGHHERSSIANSDPGALQRAAREPVVSDVIDLFGGAVVDIHR